MFLRVRCIQLLVEDLKNQGGVPVSCSSWLWCPTQTMPHTHRLLGMPPPPCAVLCCVFSFFLSFFVSRKNFWHFLLLL